MVWNIVHNLDFKTAKSVSLEERVSSASYLQLLYACNDILYQLNRVYQLLYDMLHQEIIFGTIFWKLICKTLDRILAKLEPYPTIEFLSNRPSSPSFFL